MEFFCFFFGSSSVGNGLISNSGDLAGHGLGGFGSPFSGLSPGLLSAGSGGLFGGFGGFRFGGFSPGFSGYFGGS